MWGHSNDVLTITDVPMAHCDTATETLSHISDYCIEVIQ